MSEIKKKKGMYIVLKSSDYERYMKQYPITFGPDLEAELQHFFEWKGVMHDYIVCNQDEPYAEKVWQAILDGERMKEALKE